MRDLRVLGAAFRVPGGTVDVGVERWRSIDGRCPYCLCCLGIQSPEELVYGDRIARECFGKTWFVRDRMYGGDAAYNAGWSLSGAYDDLGGRRDDLSVDGWVTALVEVPVNECAFQVARGTSPHDAGVQHECVVAAGRFGKGLVSVNASGWWTSSEYTNVFLAIANIPPAVIWSEVRHFLLAVTERNGMRRAVPASKSGLIYSLCILKVPLARLILSFAFGPLHVPQ